MWDEIYRRHYPELLRYCVKACRDRELAKDLAQETFLKALQNTDTFENLGPSQQRAWLFRTLKNLLFDRCRRAVPEAKYAETLQTEDVAPESGYQRTENELYAQSRNRNLSPFCMKNLPCG